MILLPVEDNTNLPAATKGQPCEWFVVDSPCSGDDEPETIEMVDWSLVADGSAPAGARGPREGASNLDFAVQAVGDPLESIDADEVEILKAILSLLHEDALGGRAVLRGQVRRLAASLALPNAWELILAAVLSPIDRAALPPEIRIKLNAGQELLAIERDTEQRTRERIRELLANIPRLRSVGDILYYQRKGFDGSGFPGGGFAGMDIPLGARLLKILIDLNARAGQREVGEQDFAALELQRERYDPDLLAAVRSALLDPGDPFEPSGQMPIELPVSGLLPGDWVAADVYDAQDTLVLAAGSVIDKASLQRIGVLQRIRPVHEPICVVRFTTAENTAAA